MKILSYKSKHWWHEVLEGALPQANTLVQTKFIIFASCWTRISKEENKRRRMTTRQITREFADKWYEQQLASFTEVYKTLHMIKGPERFIHLCAAIIQRIANEAARRAAGEEP